MTFEPGGLETPLVNRFEPESDLTPLRVATRSTKYMAMTTF